MNVWEYIIINKSNSAKSTILNIKLYINEHLTIGGIPHSSQEYECSAESSHLHSGFQYYISSSQGKNEESGISFIYFSASPTYQ